MIVEEVIDWCEGNNDDRAKFGLRLGLAYHVRMFIIFAGYSLSAFPNGLTNKWSGYISELSFSRHYLDVYVRNCQSMRIFENRFSWLVLPFTIAWLWHNLTTVPIQPDMYLRSLKDTSRHFWATWELIWPCHLFHNTSQTTFEKWIFGIKENAFFTINCNCVIKLLSTKVDVYHFIDRVRWRAYRRTNKDWPVIPILQVPPALDLKSVVRSLQNSS